MTTAPAPGSADQIAVMAFEANVDQPSNGKLFAPGVFWLTAKTVSVVSKPVQVSTAVAPPPAPALHVTAAILPSEVEGNVNGITVLADVSKLIRETIGIFLPLASLYCGGICRPLT